VTLRRTRLIGFALWAPILLAVAACGDDGDSNRDPSVAEHTNTIVDYSVANSLAELAAASDLVVIAEVQEVTREEVKLPSPVDPSVEARRGDVVVLATVTDSIWGDAAGLMELKLHSAEWFEVPDSDDPSQIMRIDFPELPMPVRGEMIVAFLRTDGGSVEPMSFAEVPGFGRLEGESVTFPAVELKTDGPVQQVTIPVATLDEIRDAMDRGSWRAASP
jgi:hypothetical protein